MLRTSGLFLVLTEHELETDHHKKNPVFLFTAQWILKQACLVYRSHKFLWGCDVTLVMCMWPGIKI